MPKYELMYLLGSHVSETEVPNVSAQILKVINDNDGTNVQETRLGRKKLAYPIKKTRNGFYVVVSFEMPADKVNTLEAKIRSMNSSVIRHIIVNMEEHYRRLAKDKIAQAQIARRTPTDKPTPPKAETPEPAVKLQDIDEKTLDEKIEQALSEDLIK